MQVGFSLFILLYIALSRSNLLGHIPKAGGIPLFKCYLTNGLPLILHLLHTLKTLNQASLSLLPADPIWQDLWETYADLRCEAQSVIQSNKAAKWKNMLLKLQTDFETDKRHFLATIKTFETSRLKGKFAFKPLPLSH
jgi:hypothetical protein